MEKSEVQLLFAYNAWANRKILAASAAIPVEQFISPIGYSWGSLQAILVHILSAELVWRTRLLGMDATNTFLEARDFATPAALIERWTVEMGMLQEYIDCLENSDLQRVVHYRNRRGETFAQVCWQILLHLINHGTQHRSEAAQWLTSLGHSPGDLDLIVYLRE